MSKRSTIGWASPAHGSNFPRVRLDDVLAAVMEARSIDMAELKSSLRARRVAHPRQEAMLLARRLTRNSLPALGARFGGRDHTTILHGVRAAGARADADATLDLELGRIERLLLDRAARREAAALLGSKAPKEAA